MLHRSRMDLIFEIYFAAFFLALIASGLATLTRTISPLIDLWIEPVLFLTLPFPLRFGVARRRQQLVCRAMIHYAERNYFLLDRVCDQAGAGLAEGGAEARRRWLAEINRYIDRYLGCLSKPGDIKIINEYRGDLILAIDRLVVQDIDA